MTAPALTLTFDQADAGIAAGQTDRARTDIKSTGPSEGLRAYTVNITVGGAPDGSSVDVALLDEPPSANPTLTQVSPTLWHLDFDKDCWGPFRVRARAVSGGEVLASVTRRISIRSPALGFQYPANAERIDPGATSVASAPSVALTEMNEGATNAPLAQFHRELIEKVEGAVNDGGIAEPPLRLKLYDASIEYLSDAGKYRVSAPLQARVASSMQPSHLATYPVEQFTPGGAPLSDANLAAAIEAARVYALTTRGGRVLVPLGPHSGKWAPPTGIEFDGGGAAIPLFLDTVPGGGLFTPVGADYGIWFRGSSDDTANGGIHFNGGITNWWLQPAGGGGGSHGVGFLIDAAVGCSFVNLDARAYDAMSGGARGAGLKTRNIGTYTGGVFSPGDGNNQFCRFENVVSQANQIDFDLQGLTKSFGQFHALSASYRAFLLSQCDLHILSSSLQTAAPVFVEMQGNAYVAFVEGYTESSAGPETMFLSNQLAVAGGNALYFARHRLGSPVACMIDADEFTAVHVDSIQGIGNAAKYLKSHPSGPFPAAPMIFVNAGAPDTDPGKFDLNQYSSAKLTCLNNGAAWYGSRIRAANAPVALASVAEGAEPSDAGTGDVVFNTTAGRPRVRTATVQRNLAYFDDATNLADLLAPYAEAILDPRVFANRSVIAGELDTLTDRINGAVATAPSSLRRPTWNPSDPKFGGNPSFTCVQASDKMLDMPLAHAIPSGSRPSFFAVAYATGAFPEAHPIRRRIFNTDATPFTALGWDDDDGAAWHLTSASGNSAVVSAFGDANPHIFIGNDELNGGAYSWRGSVDLTAGTNTGGGGDLGPSGSAINTVHVGAFDTGSTHASNIAIGFLAILKTPLPPSVRAKAYALATAEFLARGGTPDVPLKPVAFTANVSNYVCPARVIGVAGRPGSGGGGGGGGGGAGASASTGGGGAGGPGSAGGSCSLEYIPIDIPAGTAVDVVCGAGGTAGTAGTGGVAGGAASTLGGAGGAGGESSISIHGGAALVRLKASGSTSATVISPTIGNGGTGGGAGFVGTAAGGNAGNGVNSTSWPYNQITQSNTSGAGGNASAAGGAATVQATRTVGLRAMPVNPQTAGTAGTAGTATGTAGGGGAGAPGNPSLPGDECVSALGIAVPPATGAGSGRGASTGGNGGNGNNAGAGGAGTTGANDACTGSAGRGGGGGSGGGGGGAGSTTGGNGGNGTVGNTGDTGAWIFYFAPPNA